MAVLKKPYELSVWKEELEGVGKKAEHRVYIIGAHDMTHLGRATAIKLKTKVNGTHELTFQMIGKYFDSEKGDYVDNPFIGEVYAERKIKLYYKNKWIEFYVKQVKEDKKIKGVPLLLMNCLGMDMELHLMKSYITMQKKLVLLQKKFQKIRYGIMSLKIIGAILLNIQKINCIKFQ